MARYSRTEEGEIIEHFDSTAKTVLLSDTKHQQKMDDADSRLEGGAKSVYYPV
jgi:hypothetical protein